TTAAHADYSHKLLALLESPSMVKIALQLRFDVARILALRDGDDALDQHGPQLHLTVDDRLELVAHGQEEEVGEGDAVDGSDEGRGNTVTQLGRIRQVLHDGHQSHDRTDDAQSGRVDAHGLEHLRRL